MASNWFKIAKFPTPSHLGPSIGVTPMEFTGPETRVFGAADGEDLMIIACTVFAWSTRVSDRQTDRQTELRWLKRAIAVPAVARKNTSGINGLNGAMAATYFDQDSPDRFRDLRTRNIPVWSAVTIHWTKFCDIISKFDIYIQ